MEHKAFYKELIDTMASLIKTAADPVFTAACWRKISQRPFTLDVIRYYSVYFNANVSPSAMCSTTLFEPTETYISLIDTEDYHKDRIGGTLPLVALVHTSNGPLIAIDWWQLKSDDKSVSMFMGLYAAFRIITEDVVFDVYRSCQVAKFINEYETVQMNTDYIKIDINAMHGIIEYLNPTAMLLAFHIMSLFGVTEIDLDKIADNWFFSFLNDRHNKFIYEDPDNDKSNKITIMASILKTIKGLTNGEYDIEFAISSMTPQKLCEDILTTYVDNYKKAGILAPTTLQNLYRMMPDI